MVTNSLHAISRKWGGSGTCGCCQCRRNQGQRSKPRPDGYSRYLDTFNAGLEHFRRWHAFGIGGRGPGDVKDTGGNIRRTGQYVINLVSYELAEPMNVTAIDFPKGVDELKEAGLTTAPSLHVKPPRIAEAPVSFECERLVIVDVGVDRAVVLGKVLAIYVRDDCVLDKDRCYIDTPKLDLIGRMHGGGWYSRVTDRFELPRIPVDEWPARKAKAAE